MATPIVLAAALVLAVIAALALARWVMGAPGADVEQLALFLSVSGFVSLVVGTTLVSWTGRRLGSLRAQLAIASGAGLLVALVNVLTTSALMFLNTHDLSLLFLLLGFSTAISLAFSFAVARMLTSKLAVVSEAAARLAEGDLRARARLDGTDEIARLGSAFDHMAEELEHAFERERTLEGSRRALVASVSHDLRTPLSTTRAMIEAISDGVVTDAADVRRYLGLIGNEIQHLSRLIDDLFELSQIESGALSLTCSSVSVAALTAETLAPYDAQARDRDVTLICRVASDLPPMRADRSRMQRVLRNLVDNALRHTPAGGEIEVRGRARGEFVEIEVGDSGPGVPAEVGDRVFERFYRGDAARQRAGGAGLGLAIARGLVEAHGGEIHVAASALGGAAFGLTIPRAD